MRIAFVITGLGMGGAEVQVCNLAAGWKRRGAAVEIISLLDHVADHHQLASQSIPVRTLGLKRGRWSPADLFRYVKTARQFHPDLVHAQMFHANILARAGRPFVGAPLVCTAQNLMEGPEHSRRAPIRTRLREYAYRFSDPLCELTTQVSLKGAERYVGVGATPASKMKFVPNAVDCERFHPDASERQQLREQLRLGDTFTWIWVARMEPQKDPWTLLEAFRRAAASCPCVLLLVGKGSLEQEMRDRAAALGIAPQVRFLGPRTDIPALLNAADAFVLSSSFEGMPMVLLEAAASALPIVATLAGAEAVVPGQSGWLVATGDPEALAERMCALMALPPDARRAMGLSGRDLVTSQYALDAILDTWQRVYTSLLGKKRLSARLGFSA